jgi:hypothetical protein
MEISRNPARKLREAEKYASEIFRKINCQGRIAAGIQFEVLLIGQAMFSAFGQD